MSNQFQNTYLLRSSVNDMVSVVNKPSCNMINVIMKKSSHSPKPIDVVSTLFPVEINHAENEETQSPNKSDKIKLIGEKASENVNTLTALIKRDMGANITPQYPYCSIIVNRVKITGRLLTYQTTGLCMLNKDVTELNDYDMTKLELYSRLGGIKSLVYYAKVDGSMARHVYVQNETNWSLIEKTCSKLIELALMKK